MMLQRKGSRALAAVALAVSAVVAGCGAPESDTPHPTWSAPVPPAESSTTAPTQHAAPDLPTVESLRPDRGDPFEVIRMFCEIVFSRNAVTEESFSTSLQRAEGVMAPKLKSELLQPAKDVRPLPQWVQWQRAGAWIRATAMEASDEHPPDTPASVSRVMIVNEEPHRGDGTALEPVQSVAWVTATKEAGSWSISAFNASHEY